LPEVAAAALEALAVGVILFAVTFGTMRFLVHVGWRMNRAYELYKAHLGRSLMLGLEFLVAADIVRTVGLEPTMANVLVLGVLVLVRTLLSWSLVVEIEGRWPWNAERRTDEA